MKPPLTLSGTLRWDVVRRLLAGMGPQTAILEIGCGLGAAGTRLAEIAPYVGVELDDDSYAVAARRLAGVAGARVVHGDLSVLDPGERFSLVCAFEVLEHLEDDVAALREWGDRLTPGGHVLLSVPAYQRQYGPFDELVGHHRRYDPADIRTVLSEAGFTEPRAVVYGFPLSHALQAARNVIARRRLRAAPDSIADRTGASGRTLQPMSPAAGVATAVVAAPFRLVQRPFPSHGTGLVAVARRPAG